MHLARAIIGNVLGLLCSCSAMAQHIELHVFDSLTREPVAYSTFMTENTGFVADIDGFVSFDYAGDLSELITVRSIGYASRKLSLQALYDVDTLWLSSDVMELSEVVVRPLPARDYMLEALRKVERNYHPDAFWADHYYNERLQENNQYLSLTEAFVTASHPSFSNNIEADSFNVWLKACRVLDTEEELKFMYKERRKDFDKQQKEARKEGEELDEDDFKIPIEIGNPNIMLSIDPLRNDSQALVINDNNIAFLDSTNHEQYDFWYGKPVQYGERTLVSVHFDQKDKIKESLLQGVTWIDEKSMAFVKIDFGVSKKGMKHLVPGYIDAALWVYGLSYDVLFTKVSYTYRPYKGKWINASSRLSAKLYLEKRRFFSENEKGLFFYECEMITNRVFEQTPSISGLTAFDKNTYLSDQEKEVTDQKWNMLKKHSRTFE